MSYARTQLHSSLSHNLPQMAGFACVVVCPFQYEAVMLASY